MSLRLVVQVLSPKRVSLGKSGLAFNLEGRAVPKGHKSLSPRCQEKPLGRSCVTVPQTDSGRRG
jgi:hypothetical protein